MDSLTATFRRRVLAGIHAELARERSAAELLRAQVTPLLGALVAAARERGDCGSAWLFGSFAWGRPGARSDVDLLVDDCGDPDALAGEIWRHLGRPVHVVTDRDAPASLVERARAEGIPL